MTTGTVLSGQAAQAAERSPILEVEHLALAHVGRKSELELVSDVSFDVRPGETLGLVGESGCGKSLSALAVLRLLPTGIKQVRGEIRFEGRDISKLSPRELRAVRVSGIAAIFQDPQSCLNPAFTVGEHLVKTLKLKSPRLSRREARRRAVDLLDRVGINNAVGRLSAYPHEFSGGMAQRVMIALAIANGPRVLIADEPTTALDVTVQEQILDLLQSVQVEEGLAIVLISHDLAVVSRVANRVSVVYAGETVESGPTRRTLSEPLHPYTRALLAAQPAATAKGQDLATIPGSVPSPGAMPAGCRFANRCPDAVSACREPQVWIDLGALGGVRCGQADVNRVATPVVRSGAVVGSRPPLGDTILQVDDLCKQYAGRSLFGRKASDQVVAVDKVSFDIKQGETLALVGESGAGKSTVGRLILGLTDATAGGATFDGAPLGLHGEKRSLELRRRIQVVFQNPYATLDPKMRVGQSIAEPIEAQGHISRKARRARVQELLAQVGLPPSVADRYPQALSGGQRQRVAIARALAPEPALVVCDEPVSALDVSTQAQVINLLRRLQDERGLSYLFVSHDLAVVYHVSHRIAVMRAGTVVEIGDAEQVFNEPKHEYTKQLLASSPSHQAFEVAYNRVRLGHVDDGLGAVL